MKYGDAIELKILAANQIFSFAERAKTHDFNNLIRVTYEELLRDNLTLCLQSNSTAVTTRNSCFMFTTVSKP